MNQTDIPAFRPLPWARNGHVQTLLGAYVRSSRHPYRARRHHVELDDGDQLVLHDDVPAKSPTGCAGWQAGDPVCVLLHGLGGSHESGYMPRVAAKLNVRGVRTIRMDCRGWGAGLRLARQVGHAGRSEDVAMALGSVAELCPGSPIHLVGFSMGGNLVLKLLGEVADQPPTGLASGLAIAPPIDLTYCARKMQRGSGALYDRAFARSLQRHLRLRRKLQPDLPLPMLKSTPRRLWEFDDQVTAPLSGFKNAEDYYARASSAPLLRDIQIPTLILAAADDPLIPVEMFERATLSAASRVHVTPHGGHLGYFGVAGLDPDRRWLDWRIVERICGTAGGRERPSADSGEPHRLATPGCASERGDRMRRWQGPAA